MYKRAYQVENANNSSGKDHLLIKSPMFLGSFDKELIIVTKDILHKPV